MSLNPASFTVPAGSAAARLLIRMGVLLLLLGALVGCSGLAGEPQIVATLAPPTEAPTSMPDTGFPQTPPDLANGAAIFAEHCASCHGVNGEGDGELVKNGQVPTPGNFRDPEAAYSQFPKQWFNTITSGNLEKLMPPWKDALSEADRWDVALYTYTMHYTAKQLELGRILFGDCAECHGEEGHGDGPEGHNNPDVPAQDLTDQQELISISDKTMYTQVVEGYENVMPAYADQFNEEERQAVVAYARTLSLANVDQVFTTGVTVSAGTETAPVVSAGADTGGSTGASSTIPASITVTATGTVTNQTAGGTVPDEATVTLRVFSADDYTPIDSMTQETAMTADHTFSFEKVVIEPDKLYLAALVYQGRNFASPVVQGDPAKSTLELPITLYELTDDPATVTIDAAVTQITISGDTLEAQYAVRFVNNSDRLYTSLTADPDGRFKSVSITLPPGALVVGIADQPRYLVSEDGTQVYDTLPLQPGEQRFMQVTYLLQYSDGAIIEYPMPFQVNGQVRVLIQPENVTLTGDRLPGHGIEKLGDEDYQGYGDLLQLPANTLISYTLHGAVGDAAIVNDSGVVSSESLLPLAAVVVGLGVIVVGVVLFLRQRGKQDHNRLIDGLVRQIAELDMLHDAGQINHDLYRQRREQLKARLAELMDGGVPG